MAKDSSTIAPVEAMYRQMDLEAGLPTVQDTRDISVGIQEKILGSQTDDDVFNAASAGLASGESLVDVPHVIHGYDFNRSSFAGQSGGLPVYAIVKATILETGETISYSFGSASALTQLHTWERIQPFKNREHGLACAIAAKTTSAGFTVNYYRPLTASERKALSVSD